MKQQLPLPRIHEYPLLLTHFDRLSGLETFHGTHIRWRFEVSTGNLLHLAHNADRVQPIVYRDSGINNSIYVLRASRDLSGKMVFGRDLPQPRER